MNSRQNVRQWEQEIDYRTGFRASTGADAAVVE